MYKYPLPKKDRLIETHDVADYCAKMCCELSDMARTHKLDLLGYLLMLAQKEAAAQFDARLIDDGDGRTPADTDEVE
ncbi:hypothetical protein GCM10007094_42040 [Pseudovibrio japonicus]|uniref:Uncharacterized protein n=1 Tax=Pseudovibrio japonicus TaxID=366534 RepID=A0ABQ3ENV8_9HYPH|nr:hypothetical protein GCM10007094_42040 [Pseudovibrio japonicus]